MRRQLLAIGASVLALTVGGVGSAMATDSANPTQTNAAPSDAAANSNASEQAIHQTKSGGGDPTQSASQSSTNTQVVPVGVAPAVSAQVAPMNLNVPIDVGSPTGLIGGLPLVGALPLQPVLDTAGAVLADPVGTVDTVLADPVGSATGLLSLLPIGGLPLVGALPLQPVLDGLLAPANGLLGGLPVSSLGIAL